MNLSNFFYRLLIYCDWRSSYQEGRVEFTITSSHLSAYLKPGPGFLMSYVGVFFVFSEWKWAIRIVDQHSLNFLFIIINEFVKKKKRVTRRVPLVAHEQLNLPEHLNSTRLLIVEFPCVVFCKSLFVFPSFFLYFSVHRFISKLS